MRMTAPRAALLHETIRREGEEELLRTTWALAWSAIAAGLTMGFSFVAEALLYQHMPDVAWQELVTKFGYSVGFLIVILGRQQLFTENTLTPILQMLSRFNRKTTFQVFRLWSIVLCGNIVGTTVFAAILAFSSLFTRDTKHIFLQLARSAMETHNGNLFLSAIFAGWLIALLVWVLPYANTAKVSIIIIVTYLIGLGGFAHIVAGTTKMMYAVFTGEFGWRAMLYQYFLPTLSGNMVGGITFVALIHHAQIFAEQNHDSPGANAG